MIALFLFGLVLLFVGYLLYQGFYPLFFGAPYVPIKQSQIKYLIELLDLKKTDRVIDVGSGDGRIVMAVAPYVKEAVGVEINPLLVWWSRFKIRQRGLKNAHIYTKDLWRQDLSDFSCVTIYELPQIFSRLEKKMERELKPGSRVVSNKFKLPNWKPAKVKNRVFLYVVK